MSELIVNVAQKNFNYPLKIKKGLLDHLAEEIQSIYKNKRIAIFTDKNVHYYYGDKVEQTLINAGFDVKMIVLEPGEQTKSLFQLPDLYKELTEFGLTRSDLLLAFGGGVVGDLAGYIAATYLRGIPFVQIPTTLLAQVDSSVGGKVAVDLPQGKNLVGSFYHPLLVLIDPRVLETLDGETFSSGMAEVIKYGCIKDASFFERLKIYPNREAIMEEIEEVIAICCDTKRLLVEADEKDIGERMLLNFGHTIGHAIEAYYEYKKYTHGQAISIGMAAINQLAENKGLTPAGTTQEIRNILEQYHLPTELENEEDYTNIIPLIKMDKKNIQNVLYIVILEKMGKAVRYKAEISFFDPLLERKN